MTNAIRFYEDLLVAVPHLRRITDSHHFDFFRALSTKYDPDSFLTSPVYYAVTARRGLWLYETASSFIPVCWHPNNPGQLLVFPIRDCHADLGRLLSVLPRPPDLLRVARVKSTEALMLVSSQFPAAAPTLRISVPEHERILDWSYPVRILSTQTVAAMHGPDYRYIRNHFKQIAGRRHSIEQLGHHHLDDLADFVACCATRKSPSTSDARQRRDPYDVMMTLMDRATIAIDGFVTYIEGRIEGFTLWDVSNAAGAVTANRHVNLTNPSVRGIAEFQTVHMARQLCDQGILRMNVGGAETLTLDRFKSKFMPVRSIPLCSITVTPGRFEITPSRPLWRMPYASYASLTGKL